MICSYNHIFYFLRDNSIAKVNSLRVMRDDLFLEFSSLLEEIHNPTHKAVPMIQSERTVTENMRYGSSTGHCYINRISCHLTISVTSLS